MASIFSSPSYLIDYEIYNNLINLLTSQNVSNLGCLDYQNSLFLDQPIKLLNFNFMDKDLDIENHSKFDLAYMINKLLKERMDIIILLQKTNQERIKLREDNIALLKQIFFKSEPLFLDRFQQLFNRTFLLNYEILQHSLEKERNSSEFIVKKLALRDEEIKKINDKMHKMEKKLYKAKENFKEYLITGKLNNEEIIALGLTSNRSPISQNKEILHVNIDPFQLDFSQDWEKTSLTSTSINRKINLEQPIGLSPQHYLNDRNFEKGIYKKESQHSLLQETKSKIDRFFKNNITGNNFSAEIPMKKDNLEEKEKHLKLEGTMKLLKNISSSSLINNGSFGNVYNRTNNKLLIKKQIAHHANGKLSLNTSTQKNK